MSGNPDVSVDRRNALDVRGSLTLESDRDSFVITGHGRRVTIETPGLGALRRLSTTPGFRPGVLERAARIADLRGDVVAHGVVVASIRGGATRVRSLGVMLAAIRAPFTGGARSPERRNARDNQ